MTDTATRFSTVFGSRSAERGRSPHEGDDPRPPGGAVCARLVVSASTAALHNGDPVTQLAAHHADIGEAIELLRRAANAGWRISRAPGAQSHRYFCDGEFPCAEDAQRAATALGASGRALRTGPAGTWLSDSADSVTLP